MGKPQVLVRFKGGDHAYFDITGEDAFFLLKMHLEAEPMGWIMIGPNAILKKEELDRLFYFPDGYPPDQSSSRSAPQS